jgi:hypothetical protein
MFVLPEVQSRFKDAIFLGAAAEEALLECIEETGEAGRQRIAAYRRSIMGNLVSALVATYPVLVRIVGLPFFREAARSYIQAWPSRSGDLNEYGDQMADFIATWPHGRELPYLPDVARLEWRVQQVYYAAAADIDLCGLAACPADEYGNLCFTLTPAMSRLDSPWPLADIWRVNAADYDGDMGVDFSQGSKVLVLRRDGLVHVESLSAAEAAFIDFLGRGAPLEHAVVAGLAADANFDLGIALARFIGNGAITGTSTLARPHGGSS